MSKTIFFAILIACCSAVSYAQDYYTNGVSLTLPEPSIFATGPRGGAIIQMSIDSGKVLRPVAFSAGIPAYWRIVPEGTLLGPETFGSIPNFSQYQMSFNTPFIMGFLLDADPFVFSGPGGYGSDDRFGWARLALEPFGPPSLGNGRLTLVDSAIANGGLPIIAGTTIVVPEPPSIILMAMVALTWRVAQTKRSVSGSRKRQEVLMRS